MIPGPSGIFFYWGALCRRNVFKFGDEQGRGPILHCETGRMLYFVFDQ